MSPGCRWPIYACSHTAFPYSLMSMTIKNNSDVFVSNKTTSSLDMCSTAYRCTERYQGLVFPWEEPSWCASFTESQCLLPFPCCVTQREWFLPLPLVWRESFGRLGPHLASIGLKASASLHTLKPEAGATCHNTLNLGSCIPFSYKSQNKLAVNLVVKIRKLIVHLVVS